MLIKDTVAKELQDLKNGRAIYQNLEATSKKVYSYECL